MDRNLFDIPHHANLFALIYRAAVEKFGEKGALAADEGTKLYGQQRGARMAQRAIKDGEPLTMENYLIYGEWADKSGLSKNSITSMTPVYFMECTVCGWCDTWKKSGLLEYGKNYCTYVDKNLVKGFNPELVLDIHHVLSQGGKTCAFQWNGFKIDNEKELIAFSEKKKALGDRAQKDFLYHTGHLLYAMRQALSTNLGMEPADIICEKAMNDFAEMYGSEMADMVLTESKQDFSKVDY